MAPTWQVPARQNESGWQSALAVQLVLQALFEQASFPPHVWGVPGAHVPPLHFHSGTQALLFEHVGPPQVVVGYAQEPLPSQAPAHTVPPPRHERFPCGAAFSGMLVQVPSWPATSQAVHAPLHTVLQQ